MPRQKARPVPAAHGGGAPVELPDDLPEWSGGLVIDPFAAEGIHRARLGAGLMPEDVADATGLTARQVLEIEVGYAKTFGSTAEVVVALDELATCLNLPREAIVDASIARWTGARPRPARPAPGADGHGEAELDTAQVAPVRAPAHDTRVERLATVGPDTSPGTVPKTRRSRLHVNRVAVGVAAALTVVIVGVYLGTTTTTSSKKTAPPRAHPTTAPPTTAHPSVGLLTAGTSSADGATYSVAAASFTVSVSTTAPCWVQIGPPNGPSTVAQTLQPGQSVSTHATATVTAQVGAGGCTVTVSTAHKHASLSPQVAPFTYTLQPTG